MSVKHTNLTCESVSSQIQAIAFGIMVAFTVCMFGASAFCADEKAESRRIVALQREAEEVVWVKKDYQKGLKLYDQLSSLEPGNIQHYIAQAQCYRFLKEFDNALRKLAVAEQVEPESLQIALEQGFTHLMMGDKQGARRMVKRAGLLILHTKYIFPDWFPVFANLCYSCGMCQVTLKELGLSEKKYKKLFSFRQLEPLEKRAIVDYALSDCTSVTKMTPQSYIDRLDLVCGFITVDLWCNGDVGGIIPLCRAAIKNRPKNPNHHLLLGVALLEEGKTADAKTEIAIAEKLRLFNPLVRSLIATRCASLVGHHQDARVKQLVHFSKVYLASDSSTAKTTLELLISSNNLEAATDLLTARPRDPLLEKLRTNLALCLISAGNDTLLERLYDLKSADVSRINSVVRLMRKTNLSHKSLRLLLQLIGRLREIAPDAEDGGSHDHELYETLKSMFEKTISKSWNHRLLSSGELEEHFIQPIEQSLNCGPLPAYCLEELVLLYARSDDLSRAEEIADACVKQNSSSARLLKLRAAIKLRLGNDSEAMENLRMLSARFGEQCTIEDLRKLRQTFESKLPPDILVRKFRSGLHGDTKEYLLREESYFVKKAELTKRPEPFIEAAEIAVARCDNSGALRLIDRAQLQGSNASRLFEVKSWALEALGRKQQAKEARSTARSLRKSIIDRGAMRN